MIVDQLPSPDHFFVRQIKVQAVQIKLTFRVFAIVTICAIVFEIGKQFFGRIDLGGAVFADPVYGVEVLIEVRAAAFAIFEVGFELGAGARRDLVD